MSPNLPNKKRKSNKNAANDADLSEIDTKGNQSYSEYDYYSSETTGSTKENTEQEERCHLCGREGVEITEHHLIPRSQAKRRGIKINQLPTVNLCASCHKFLHLKFSNAQLAREYNTIEALLANEEVKKFVAWLSKQPASKRVRVR